MAGQTGGSSPDLKSDVSAALKLELLKEAHAFSFFQVIRLLRCYDRRSFEHQPPASDFSDNIRVKPNLSLAFPSSDVETVEEQEDHEDQRFLITANFLGLYGSSSPLPTFYTEDLIDEELQDESVARDFIDITNQRLFALLFRCWSKYRLHLKVLEEKSQQQIEQLFCLLGLGETLLRQDIPEPYKLLRYIGLFTQFPRSAMGLKTLLQNALAEISVEVIPCIQRKAKIPDSQTLRTGISGSSLGVNSYLGNEIDDRMGKFRLQLGPLRRTDFHKFIPGTDGFKWLTFLTEMYIVEPLVFDVELIMASGEARTVCLGDPSRSTLGVDSWTFSADEWGEVRAIFPS
jgi:type VI secretion system protein ImpH